MVSRLSLARDLRFCHPDVAGGLQETKIQLVGSHPISEFRRADRVAPTVKMIYGESRPERVLGRLIQLLCPEAERSISLRLIVEKIPVRRPPTAAVNRTVCDLNPLVFLGSHAIPNRGDEGGLVSRL
jgi:hypothetical protein